MVAAETLIGDLESPDSNLWTEVFIDLLHNIRVFDNHLQRYDVSRCMDTFIRACASHKRGLFRVCRIGFGDGTGGDEC